MALVFTAGPCHAWVGFRTGDVRVFPTLFYLGSCEVTPSAVLRPHKKPVLSSVSGTMVPHDMSDQGEDAIVGLPLNRYNANVLALVRRRARQFGAANPPPGLIKFGDIGSLALTEGYALALALRFPYGDKPVFQQNGMPAGYRFFAAVPIGPDDLGNLNTEARKETVVFHCLPVYNYQTGDHDLYDNNMAGIPAVPNE